MITTTILGTYLDLENPAYREKCRPLPGSPGRSVTPATVATALEDIKPDRSFVVYGGTERYRKGDALKVIGLRELAELLRDLN